jgi:hypothetical protein
MPAPVTLLARKFTDGDKMYRTSLRPSIDAHPQRDRIVELIEAQDINYKTGNRRRKRTTARITTRSTNGPSSGAGA